tara:strand:- start:102 stop:788 length:687 start_codon:yes stop_codon:yes gene_type:complete
MKNYLIRTKKNLKNYFSTRHKAKNSPGLLRRDSEAGKLIEKLIVEESLTKILEIGTWNGLGSTSTLIETLNENFENYNLISIESDKAFYKQANKNLSGVLNENIQLLLGRIIDIEDLPSPEDIDFRAAGLIPENIEWLIQDIRRYKKTKNISSKLPDYFDFILFDGGEFSNFHEFIKLYKKTKFLGLDDTNTYKQFNVLKFIERNEKSFELIYQLESFNIYKVLNINN